MVGNAAGEAHPIVAEGISMAIQSSSLLCSRLMAHRPGALTQHLLDSLAVSYADSWRKNFARRVHAAAVFANLATQPLAAKLSIALLKRAPSILTWGAYLAGKSQLPAFIRSDAA